MPEQQEAIRFERKDNGRYLLTGVLSFETIGELTEKMDELTAGSKEVLLDLAGVTKADSSGIVMLVEWMRIAKTSGKKVAFTNIPPQMMDIARVSDLDGILPMFRI